MARTATSAEAVAGSRAARGGSAPVAGRTRRPAVAGVLTLTSALVALLLGTAAPALAAPHSSGVSAAAAGLPAAPAKPQSADSSYRYWSFWTPGPKDGEWRYANTGPAQTRPVDGSVYGFRFTLSQEGDLGNGPRGPYEFAAICKGRSAEAGSVRVALVLDFGDVRDAPKGETPPKQRTACAVVEDNASVADALAGTAKPLRYDSNSMLCAIDGYPRTGCGEKAEPREPAGSATPPEDREEGVQTEDGPNLGAWAGLAVVVVLGAAAVWQIRRRRG